MAKINYIKIAKKSAGIQIAELKKINKVLFSSVVPNAFKFVKTHLNKAVKTKCVELKSCKLNNFIKILVNKNGA